MIKVHRLNDKEFVVNDDLILYIEETPDTVITLTTGQKIVVLETPDEIIDKVAEFRGTINNYKKI